MSTNRNFVFLDPTGRRWPRMRTGFLVAGALVLLAAVSFIRALFVTPILTLPPQVREMKGQLHELQQENPSAQQALMNRDWLKFYRKTVEGNRRMADLHTLAPPLTPGITHKIRTAFYVDYDPNSYDSLVEHISQLTHLIPEWLSIRSLSDTIVDHSNLQVANLTRAHGVVLMPLLTNLDIKTWYPEAVESLARGTTGIQDRFIGHLVDILHHDSAGGVVIDWQQIDPTLQKQYTVLLNRIAQRLHDEHMELWLAVSASHEFSTFDLETLSQSVDHFVALLYDETSDVDPAGPIASLDWFAGWLHVFLAYGEPAQWIACIGNYAYDWSSSSKSADTLSFIDAMARASHVGSKKAVSGDPGYNPHFSYGTRKVNHSVWFLDVATFMNHWIDCQNEDVGGVGIYRLGTEDPSLWYAMLAGETGGYSPEELSNLELLKSAEVISNIDHGEFLTVDLSHKDGHRKIVKDAKGVYHSNYLDFPQYPTLYHQGEGSEHEVALSFDDGPDPRWTPMILDILKDRHVKAAFFITGKQAESHPDLVRRILREGHEIGNHTYSHPNLSLASSEQETLELNATQRIIEGISGLSTTLFRPPYNADSHPHEMQEVEALSRAQDLGYLTVCENIDPEDWSRPGSQIIVDRVRQQRQLGNIILLHDAGGDRSQTISALPKIIDFLQMRGDEIVSLGRLVGLPRDQLMPPLSQNRSGYESVVTSAGFQLLRTLEESVWAFIILATFLLVVRSILVLFLSLRYRPVGQLGVLPSISVVIAAYNEEKIIAATLRSVLNSSYPSPIEIVVVDDGSKDGTYGVVVGMAQKDSRIHLYQQANQGKAQALRHALQRAHHEIIVFLDADTQLAPYSLLPLINPFSDASVGAVSGHAKVGNLRTFMARCQALEYTCGFNLDRRAYHVVDAITVVPGAISAARTVAIQSAGGINSDTLAEDTDLTLSLHRLHYKIVYADKAVAYTEAPEHLYSLTKQRVRWAFGTLQCLWKHRDLVFSPSHGWLAFFSLPGAWFFHITLVAMAPMIDLMLLYSFVLGRGSSILPYFLTFLGLDMLLALVACILEGEGWHHSLLILPMRIIYRPMLTIVLWTALFRAMKGAWVGWGKLERTASVGLRR